MLIFLAGVTLLKKKDKKKEFEIKGISDLEMADCWRLQAAAAANVSATVQVFPADPAAPATDTRPNLFRFKIVSIP
jgi:hypothetical protein